MTRTERQLLALKRWKEFGCRATIVAATGFGKSRMALTAMKKVLDKNPLAKVVLIVPTKILQKQWNNHLEEWHLNAEVIVMNTAAKKPFKADMLVVDKIVLCPR